MSISLANLKLAVYSRLNPEGSTPAYAALDAGNITRWANEKTAAVILALDPSQYQALIIPSASLSFTLSGQDRIVAVPSSPVFIKAVSIRVGASLKRCVVYDNPDDYARWDSGNFIYTPTASKPIAKIVNNYIYIRPNTITSGMLEYIKEHPTLSDSQATLFSAIGDNMLIDLVVAEAMKHLQLVD